MSNGGQHVIIVVRPIMEVYLLSINNNVAVD